MKQDPQPKKQLGQHWLHDLSTLWAICDEADLTPDDTVLEIGPGLGVLTVELAERVKQVIAVEFDPSLAKQLHKRVPRANLQTVQGDILQFDLTTLPKNYKVVANLPYYITSKIVRMLLESANPPAKATLLVQKEVAHRMAAKPGMMSVLSVAVQYYAKTRLGPVVPAELFTPPPKVDSQVITLTRREKPLFTTIDTKLYFRLVRAGFGEKRKKLRNSLSGGLQLDKNKIETLLQKAGIEQTARAEQLSLEQWHALMQAYEQLKHD